MKHIFERAVGLLLSFVLAFSSVGAVSAVSVYAAGDTTACGGWFESLYAVWEDSNAKGATVQYKRSEDSAYVTADNELIRQYGSEARVDVVGIFAGYYDLRITTSSGEIIEKNNIRVDAYDRSGYAHFQYNQGVGAYNNDGSPKSGAIIIYLTEENKNTVTIPGYESQVGIGNILNCCTETGAQKVLTKMTVTDNHPLIIRVIGTVTLPDHLSVYDSTEYGGVVGDNGGVATIKGARNITVEGIGDDACIDGWGMSFYHSNSIEATTPEAGESFEVRNITFKNYPEDALGFQGEMQSKTAGPITAPIQRCWVHNNSFYPGYCANPTDSDKAEGDGSCDFKRGYNYTLSYNYFENCHKTNLIGASKTNLQFNITMHHNWWNGCGSRMPLARQANIHSYNNYFYGSTSTTIDVRANGYVFSEGNYFDTCKNPYSTNNEGSSYIKSYNDVVYNLVEQKKLTDGLTIADTRDQQVTTTNQYPNFDTDTSVFYYDAVNKRSNVSKLTDAVSAKAECIAYSGVLKTQKADIEEPSVTTDDTTPDGPVTVPYSIDFTAANDLGTVAAGEIKQVDNIVFKAAKKYSGSDGLVIKENGITFTLDKYAEVTISDGTATKSIALVDKLGNPVISPDLGGSASAVLSPGTYVIQSSYTLKESKITSLIINEYTGETPTEATSEYVWETTTEKDYFPNVDIPNYSITGDPDVDTTTEKQTYTTTEKTDNDETSDPSTETSTEPTTQAPTEKPTETTTARSGRILARSLDVDPDKGDKGNGKPYYDIEKSETAGESTNSVKIDDDGYIYIKDTDAAAVTVYNIPFDAQSSGKIKVTGIVIPVESAGSWTIMKICGKKTADSETDEEIVGLRSNKSKVYSLRVNASADENSFKPTEASVAAGDEKEVEFLIDLDNKIVSLTIDGVTVEDSFEASDISNIRFETATGTRNLRVSDIMVVRLYDGTEEAENPAYYADADGDGEITATDAAYFKKYIVDGVKMPVQEEKSDFDVYKYFDLNGDTILNSADAERIIWKALDDDYWFFG